MISALALAAVQAQAQAAPPWAEPRRGSWAQMGIVRSSDAVLVGRDRRPVQIVVAGENSIVRRAAEFLAEDLRALTGVEGRPVPEAGRGARIVLRTRSGDPRWEAYSIEIKRGETGEGEITIEGSNPRGTAFGAYELMERMGRDPLHHWTGIEPKPRVPFVLRSGRHESGPPTFRFRGLFHDDEDILPRPLDPRTGYPFVRGTVPDEWYGRYFETALRLRMNMVVPYTRSHRQFRVQKMASDWGLYYSGQHYDTLLSNPYGFANFGLAKARGVEVAYDWHKNREGFLKYWRGGVEENKGLRAIWPVGLRGTDDLPYKFPDGTTNAEKGAIWTEAIAAQVAMVKAAVPETTPGSERIFHHTLYNEMMEPFVRGDYTLPEDVIVVWDDNGDGVLRGLPTSLPEERRRRNRHGIYYHLAFFGANAKQSVHTVTPDRIAREWGKAVAAGATEYGLTNVSELREHIMETRLIAATMWDAPAALAGADPAREFVRWWSREYFDSEAPAATYEDYYRLLDAADNIYKGSGAVLGLMDRVLARFNGQAFEMPPASEIAVWESRRVALAEAIARGLRLSQGMEPVRRQFFREHALLGLQFMERPYDAARHLVMALQEPDDAKAKRHLLAAYVPLARLETEIRAAERAPFTDWYRPTWIRRREADHNWSNMYPRRPIEGLRTFLIGMGLLPDAKTSPSPSSR